MLVTLPTHINSASNFMNLLFKYNLGNSKMQLFEISLQEIFSIFLTLS